MAGDFAIIFQEKGAKGGDVYGFTVNYDKLPDGATVVERYECPEVEDFGSFVDRVRGQVWELNFPGLNLALA